MSSKQYGLIIPGKLNKVQSQIENKKPFVFNENDDSDEELPLHMQMPARKSLQGPGIMEQRIAKQLQEKALKEDPTVFQYDELYEDMEQKREEEKSNKSKEPRKPKYIGRLMECAQRRKLENELRMERQVQKEREQEGDEFKDKESFVTSAYRKKLEELRKLQEEEKRDEYLEAIGDVTKQKDLDGFYRHLYEQKTKSSKEIPKPSINSVLNTTNEDVSYKPILSGKSQQRAYRKRKSSVEDDENKIAEDHPDLNANISDEKKSHIANNIDADSDFSIDSESSDDDNNESNNKQFKKESENFEKKGANRFSDPINNTVTEIENKTIALNFDALKQENVHEVEDSNNKLDDNLADNTSKKEIKKLKQNKKDIWNKRTIGVIFDAAVQRYFERKAVRNG